MHKHIAATVIIIVIVIVLVLAVGVLIKGAPKQFDFINAPSKLAILPEGDTKYNDSRTDCSNFKYYIDLESDIKQTNSTVESKNFNFKIQLKDYWKVKEIDNKNNFIYIEDNKNKTLLGMFLAKVKTECTPTIQDDFNLIASSPRAFATWLKSNSPSTMYSQQNFVDKITVTENKTYKKGDLTYVKSTYKFYNDTYKKDVSETIVRILNPEGFLFTINMLSIERPLTGNEIDEFLSSLQFTPVQ